MSNRFDLRPYMGCARTRYVLDASVVEAGMLAGMTSTSGNGRVDLAPLSNAGGRITLSAPSTAGFDRAAVELPVKVGNSSGSLRAWSVEVEGLTCTSTRGVFGLGSEYANDEGYTGLRWDASGVRLSTSTSAPSRTLKAGNFHKVSGICAGVLVEVPTGGSSSARATGAFGGVHVQTGPRHGSDATPAVAAQGLQVASLFAHTLDGIPAEVSFSRLVLTCFWNVPGGLVERVF